MLIVLGSRNLRHFDAALVCYTFAVLFATFGITRRYALWIQRPPTAMYWRRGWTVFLRLFRPRHLFANAVAFVRRVLVDFAMTRFIWRRGRIRWAAHWCILWGCVTAAAITFPLVFGWIHFATDADDFEWYRVHVFGQPTIAFPIHSLFGFFVFHGLVWSSLLVVAGVLLSFRRLPSRPRQRPHVAVLVQ